MAFPARAATDAEGRRLSRRRAVNRFIAGKQETLFDAPDAFYRQEGADAVDGAPAITQRLQALRTATLDQARDDSERAALGPRLDLHIEDAMDGVDRHVSKQQEALQRQIVSERQTLIQRAAELEHDNDGKIHGLADAHASAALERARMDGIAPDSPEEAAAISGARSQILRAAIDQRIATGKGAQALAMFERAKDELAPADRRALDVPIQVAVNDAAANAWLQRETEKPGETLMTRAAADPALSPEQTATVVAKIAAREATEESRRIATVKGLDDRLADSRCSLATRRATYKPGTFAALADAYDEAGEPAKALDTRGLAFREPFLAAFAQSSPAGQQRVMESLPESERPAADAIQRQQAKTFGRDPFAAGTALYPDVGPPRADRRSARPHLASPQDRHPSRNARRAVHGRRDWRLAATVHRGIAAGTQRRACRTLGTTGRH
jgi:hypothetical protein